MSLESFFGIEEGESSGSAEAAEKFREQMRKNAKAIKAMTGHFKQQKSKEDRLARLLAKFLQDQGKNDLVFLIVKLLGQNVPGAFLLAILSIADRELEQELLKSIKKETPTDHTLIHFSGEFTLPEAVRNQLNAWGDTILNAGLMMPTKTLDSVLTADQKLKSLILDLINYALEEYFEHNGIEISHERVRQFALLSIQSVLIKLREVASQKSDAEIIETPL